MKVKKMTYKLSKEQAISLNTKGEVEVEKGTTIIKEDAFRGCLKLRKIVIPASVKLIEKNAFRICLNLRKIVFEGVVPTYQVEAFAGCDNIEEVEYTVTDPECDTEIYPQFVRQFFGVKNRVIVHYPNGDEKEM